MSSASGRLPVSVTLHIGHGKTGSSFIQSSLALSQEALAGAGIRYPDFPNLEHARSGGTSSGNLRPDDQWSSYVLRVATQVSERRVLFSNEALLRSIRRAGESLERLRDAVSLDLVLFIRDPVEHALSSYVQLVKRDGETRDLEAFLASYQVPQAVDEVLRHARACDVPVTVRNYSRHRGHLLATFAECIGLPDAALLTQPTVPNINRSLTRSELQIQLLFNERLAKGEAAFVSDVLCERLPQIRGELPALGKEAYEALRRRVSPAVAAVNDLIESSERYRIETYDAWMAGAGSPPPATGPRLTNEQLEVLVDAVCARLERFESLNSLADIPRDAALRAERGELLTLEDAMRLMEVAHQLRPQGPFIAQKLQEYRRRLSRNRD